MFFKLDSHCIFMIGIPNVFAQTAGTWSRVAGQHGPFQHFWYKKQFDTVLNLNGPLVP
jgi:hypothetical protein